MQSIQSVWNALIQYGLSAWQYGESAWNWLAQSPHTRLYVAIAGGVVFLLLVAWAMPGRRGIATLSLNQPEPKQRGLSRAALNDLSLNQPVNEPRNGAITPVWAARRTAANVTPIDRGRAARCTHCQATLEARCSFCPACGYAQPVTQTGTAARL